MCVYMKRIEFALPRNDLRLLNQPARNTLPAMRWDDDDGVDPQCLRFDCRMLEGGKGQSTKQLPTVVDGYQGSRQVPTVQETVERINLPPLLREEFSQSLDVLEMVC